MEISGQLKSSFDDKCLIWIKDLAIVGGNCCSFMSFVNAFADCWYLDQEKEICWASWQFINYSLSDFLTIKQISKVFPGEYGCRLINDPFNWFWKDIGEHYCSSFI